MRILKVVQFYFPFQDRGGPVFKIRALARNLVQRGHQVTILTADLGVEKHQDFDKSYERCEYGWQARNDGVETIYFSTVAQYHALTLNPGLYDLLGPAVSYFCKRQKIPYVVEPLGMYRPIDRSLRIKRLWHRTLGRNHLNRAARIMATSELERREWLEDGISPEKVIVRYNGIDSETFAAKPTAGGFRAKWNIPPGEPVVLFLGRLIPRKNADMLIKAFAEACPKNGRLVIAGPDGVPGYLATLKHLASECGVESRVIFTGALYDDAKVAAMTDADIFVLPSRYENFANAPGEAIACGIPVIVTGTCGISPLIKDRAGLVIIPALNQLINALCTLLTDRNLYDRFKRGCQVVASELRWDQLTQQMESCYKQVMAQEKEIPRAARAISEPSSDGGYVETRK
jgi:glycosyltransferase involved in cell wall biosynthesis